MARITVFAPDGKRVLEIGLDGSAVGPLAEQYMTVIKAPAYEPKRTVKREGKLLTVFGPISAIEKARTFLVDLATAGYSIKGSLALPRK